MHSRTIPSTGEQIPAIGLGTWHTFDATESRAISGLSEVVAEFFRCGGRVIDSSPMYGSAESVVGDLTTQQSMNEKCFIATKVWTRGADAGIKQMRESLRNLGRKQIDLMQVHNLVDWRSHIKTLRELKDAGTIRYIGITHWEGKAMKDLEYVMRREKVDFVQSPYSVTVRDAEKRVLPLAQELGVAVLVNRPFEEGEIFQATRDEPLPEFMQPYASSWSQAFLKFILAHPAVTCVIPATTKIEHLRDNMRAGEGELPDRMTCERFSRFVSKLQQPAITSRLWSVFSR